MSKDSQTPVRGRCRKCGKTDKGCLSNRCGFVFAPISQWRQRQSDFKAYGEDQT